MPNIVPKLNINSGVAALLVTPEVNEAPEVIPVTTSLPVATKVAATGNCR